MIYEMRLKGREKQGECSAILAMCFLILQLTVFSLSLLPLVYVTAVRPVIAGTDKENLIAVAFSAAVLILISVLFCGISLGADRFMLKRAENIAAGAGDIFYYLSPKRVFSMSWFMLRFALYKFVVLSLFSLPAVLCAAVFYRLCIKGFSAAVCSIFGIFTVIFFILALHSYSEFRDSYFPVRYRYIKGDSVNFRHLLSQSQQDMSVKMRKLRKLKWSFAGWFLLCVLIVPLPYVWSYYRQTKACFAIEEY